MIRKLFRIATVIIAVTFVYEVKAQDVAFGLKGGVNLTNLNVSNAQGTYDSRTGYHAGIFLRGKFNKVGVQPEVLLFTQSNKIDYGSLGTVKQSFTYLSIPVMLKFYPVGGLNIQAGPQFGFLLDGQRKYDNGFVTTNQNIKDYYKSSDVSLSFGAGYDFGFGLGFDVRYNLGIQDINAATDGEKVKSQVFLVSLGWNFLR
ncbi:MAG TPA: porin family protein [Cyclobacteriaceae bacterium]